MSPVYRGATRIMAIYRGSTPVPTVYRGGSIIPITVTVNEDFNRDDASTLGAAWVDHGPSTDYKLGIDDGRARVKIPDGLIGGFWAYRTSFARYTTVVASIDDGYVECRPATKGDPVSLTSLAGYNTDVYGRASNTAATHGVGIRMRGGQLWIVRRVADTTTQMVDCGTFQAGDVIRLSYVGNVHTMTKNGGVVGTPWNDSTGTALKGPTYRSLLIRSDGAKDLLGPRRFSPALDYVAMG